MQELAGAGWTGWKCPVLQDEGVNVIATMNSNMFSKCTPAVRWVQPCMWLLGCVCAFVPTCLCVAMLVDM